LSVEECDKLTDGQGRVAEEEETDDGLKERAPLDFLVIMAKDATKDKAWALKMYGELIHRADTTNKYGSVLGEARSQRMRKLPKNYRKRPELVVPYVDYAKLLIFDLGYNPLKKRFQANQELYNPKEVGHIFSTLRLVRFCLEAAIDFGDDAHFSARYRLADLQKSIVPAAFDPQNPRAAGIVDKKYKDKDLTYGTALKEGEEEAKKLYDEILEYDELQTDATQQKEALERGTRSTAEYDYWYKWV